MVIQEFTHSLIETLYLRGVGKWSTKTIEPQHWNEDLLRSVDIDLSPIFDEIHDEGCEHFASSVAESVNETVDILNNALKGNLHVHTLDDTALTHFSRSCSSAIWCHRSVSSQPQGTEEPDQQDMRRVVEITKEKDPVRLRSPSKEEQPLNT